jgi:putative tricarboxylic transport membrane protein
VAQEFSSSSQSGASRSAWPELLIAGGLLAFACVVLAQVWAIPPSPMYATVGPAVFPYVAVAGLFVLAVLMFVQAWRGGWQPTEEKEVPIDWWALAFVVAGLLANIALIDWAGFTAASTLMFVLIAYGFGSRTPLPNAAIGFVIALAAYFGFAKALGVNIGAGLVERFFERLIAVAAGWIGF